MLITVHRLIKSQTAIAVFHKDGDLRSLRALVVGPPETPFQFGYFEVSGLSWQVYPHLLTLLVLDSIS
jgi:hypothetical protein